MKKLLVLTYNTIIFLLLSLLVGCKSPANPNEFKQHSYDDYYNALENTTIQIELIIDNKRAICYYTNNAEFYIYTIKYQYSNEYGYIYNTKTNELYYLENQRITSKIYKDEAEELITYLYNNANILFHLQYDYKTFEYVNTVTVCNRICDKYRFTKKINGQKATFNIYIDKITGFCLKGICVVDEATAFYFEAKRFLYEPSVNNYIREVNAYNLKNTH